MASSEWAKIDLLRRELDAPAPGVLTGIGDDAAVLSPGAAPLVWTVDAAVDGVHFRRDLLTMEDIGWRATMAASSDLAAMGASPRGLLAALVLPEGFGDEDLAALARGQREAAEALGTAIVGGNLARGVELSITTTALGETPRPLARAGAQPGDSIQLAGAIGPSAAGLALLLEKRPIVTEPARAAVLAWRRPRARLEAGLLARPIAHAAIDVSDGLAQDVGHLAQASGARAILDAAAIVTPELAAIAAELGRDPLELALHGGEDYALVIALPPGEALPGFRLIGRFEAGPPDVLLAGADGTLAPIAGRGFDHFRG